MGQPSTSENGREGNVGSKTRRYAVRLSLRCSTPPRPAFKLPATDGREGSFHLRSVRRRSGDVGIVRMEPIHQMKTAILVLTTLLLCTASSAFAQLVSHAD